MIETLRDSDRTAHLLVPPSDVRSETGKAWAAALALSVHGSRGEFLAALKRYNRVCIPKTADCCEGGRS